jgi:hypothetical protein
MKWDAVDVDTRSDTRLVWLFDWRSPELGLNLYCIIVSFLISLIISAEIVFNYQIEKRGVKKSKYLNRHNCQKRKSMNDFDFLLLYTQWIDQKWKYKPYVKFWDKKLFESKYLVAVMRQILGVYTKVLMIGMRTDYRFNESSIVIIVNLSRISLILLMCTFSNSDLSEF